MSGDAWYSHVFSMPLWRVVGLLAEELSELGVTGEPADHEDNPNIWHWLLNKDQDLASGRMRGLYDVLIELEPMLKTAAWHADGDSDAERFAGDMGQWTARQRSDEQMLAEGAVNTIADALGYRRPLGHHWRMVERDV